jgi:phospholipase C
MKFMARNDITGKVIKTNPQSQAYADGWERIYAKKTAYEWSRQTPYTILDPDGWRENDGVTMDTPIKWSDFQRRLNKSTLIGNLNYEKD